MNGKHLSLEDRIRILEGVGKRLSIRAIAKAVSCAPSTVSRELKKRRILEERTCWRHESHGCLRTSAAPWVCDGCPNLPACHNRKYRYRPQKAQQAYEKELHECRQKIRTGAIGMDHIDAILTPLIQKKHQTLGHVYAVHGHELGISRSTCYRYISQGRLTVKDMDLPRRVRYRRQKKAKKDTTVWNPRFRENRDYAAFQAFASANPTLPVAEMDSVIGKPGTGEKVLLTVLLRKSNFMLAFLREKNDAQSVIDLFDRIQKTLGIDRFRASFAIILTDNGSEFKRPEEMERSPRGKLRCHIFYCDARASQQKGRCEKNHEYIRMFFPHGASFSSLTQSDVNLMMSHINSVRRDSFKGLSPFDLLTKGQLSDMKKLGLTPIPPDRVVLSPSLFNTKQ